jgi:hypothetical protein
MGVSDRYFIHGPDHNACLEVCIIRPLNYLILLFIDIFHAKVLIWVFFTRICHVEEDVISICRAQVIKKIEAGAYCAQCASLREGFTTSVA